MGCDSKSRRGVFVEYCKVTGGRNAPGWLQMVEKFARCTVLWFEALVWVPGEGVAVGLAIHWSQMQVMRIIYDCILPVTVLSVRVGHGAGGKAGLQMWKYSIFWLSARE